MSERAKRKNHPQSPRQLPKIGSGRGRAAKGYDEKKRVWVHSAKKVTADVGR